MGKEIEIINEIKYFQKESKKLNVSLSTTAALSSLFKKLPVKQALGYTLLNYLIREDNFAEKVLSNIDGIVDNILIDIEKKQDIDLWKIAKYNVSKSNLIPIKPNDATLEATYLLIKHKLNNDLSKKKVLIYGAGNLGSKLALRLAESNSKVYLKSRNHEKVTNISKAFNSILPTYAEGRVIPLRGMIDLEETVDLLVSFISADQIVSGDYVEYIKKEGIALDGGINNFTANFLSQAHKEKIQVIRVDVRLGTPHLLLSLLPETERFFTEVQGERVINGIRVVSGGIIGKKGDIVVDQIKSPSKVIGIANGYGGLLVETTKEDKQKIQQFKEIIQAD